jgi:hypothetical protein
MFHRSLVFFLICISAPALAQKFYPDDPIDTDRDDLPIDKPGTVELSPTYDLLENTFARPELPAVVPRAVNVNTLGKVPNSSWFENRIGAHAMTLEELARGPNWEPPPRPPYRVIAGKASGITPGFTIRDAGGRVFFVKFDPMEHPNLSTGADIISKNFFYAIGYHVPAAYLFYPRLEDLSVEPGAKVRLKGKETAPLDESFLRSTLDDAAHQPDGRVRALASLSVPGEAVGPFQFLGTRPDDPNDVFPHEDRRELRGYRVFCAWLNHDDSRAINTLDTFVRDGAGGHLRHYLIDFGSTLGSGSDHLRRVAPQDPRGGNEYIVDFDPIWRAAYSFGILDRPWRAIDYPYPRYAEIGRIESEHFDPALWKPEYPNPAFDRMLADDAFWAARIVSRFSDEAIRTIVSTGEYLSLQAERYLADTLIQRRDKIVEHYYRQLDPVVDFSAKEFLEFRHLGVERGLGDVQAYEYEWFAFDNDTGESTPLGLRGRVTTPRIPLPDSDSPYLEVRVHVISQTESGWRLPVDVYLRGREVVGIEREIPE